MSIASNLDDIPNLVTLFFDQAARLGDRPFLWARRDGAWVATSWAEAARTVAHVAAGLRALGIEHGDRVLLVAENRPEWPIADLAVMAAGGVTVPTYTSNTIADHAHVLADSGARLAIVSNAKLAKTLLPAVADADACAAVIAMEAVPSPPVPVHGWVEMQRLADPAEVAGWSARVGRSDLACLIYTSGTGGAPKGVRHHHGAILANVAGAARLVDEDFGLGDEAFLSVLPPSHAYEHTAGQYLPIAIGAEIHYAQGIDKLAGDILDRRPTIMVVVPRLFELLRARILRQVEKESRFRRWLFAQALAPRSVAGRLLKPLLDRTVRRSVRDRFGGRMKALVSGGAPLEPEVGRFFEALGLTILQGYGQTEAAPIIACNRPRAGIALETVGPPFDGVELRIADDGEILVRGESVTHGYWNNPAATAEAIRDGWLHTGDIGTLDARGRLKITDRKKDLIVNDKGENVAPQRVEGLLTMEPEIGQAMVVGDRRPYLVGLVVPDAEWKRARPDLDEAAVERAMAAAVDRVNKRLSATEKVRRTIVADEPFTIDNGEMTPSLKIRRHRIRARYGDRLDALYRAD